MEAQAIIFAEPRRTALSELSVNPPSADDVVVDMEWSGISTGTERLLWSGRMPSFPGMGYPLVPGYESVGRIVEAGPRSGRRAGERVFVPGANCYGEAKGLFGGTSSRVVIAGAKAMPVDESLGERAILLGLAATAHHAVSPDARRPPELIIGHGVLGRLIARLACAAGGRPTVWERDPARRAGGEGYDVIDPEADARHDYRRVCDASGDPDILDTLVLRLARGGEIVLAGFYDQRLSFAFPPAFMREAQIRIAAEWRQSDLTAVREMTADGRLSLDGLITHRASPERHEDAYATAFTDAGCLKMVFDWRNLAWDALTTPSEGGLRALDESIRAETAMEPEPVHVGEVKKETQIIAIYGKGGIGKSFTLANLSHMMANSGKRVLLIGCDPKSDTTSLLFGGRACPTIIETSSRKKAAGEDVQIGDVCFKSGGVFAMELGGPEVGRGCGGRGIIHGFELLEKLGFHEWGFDYVLLDFLGDVVCGGFGLPIARDMCQKVIVVGSNDLQSLYVANNVCSAVDYFRKLGGNVGVAGMVINKDDGTGEAAAFAAAVGIPVLASIPADDDIRRKSANYQIIGYPGGPWGSLFEGLATSVAESGPQRPTPLSQDQLLSLFSCDQTGASVVLEPATQADMRGGIAVSKPSLEVIYDAA